MRTCAGCGGTLPPVSPRPGRRRKWCSERCRRRTLYAGQCVECGAPTDGSNGRERAPERCLECAGLGPWTRAGIILAIQEWADDHGGVPPRVVDLRDPALPVYATVVRHFGVWNAALLAAGYELHCDRRVETWIDIRRSIEAGDSVRDIADRYGVSSEAIYQRLRVRGLTLAELRSAA